MSDTLPAMRPAGNRTSVQAVQTAWANYLKWLQSNYSATLVNTDENTGLLSNWMRQQGHDLNNRVYSAQELVDLLYAATKANLNHLQWTKEPKALRGVLATEAAQKFEAKEIERRVREQIDNSKTFDVEGRNRAAEEETAKNAENEQARYVRAKLINSWTVNAGPDRIDESKSAEGRAFLNSIRIKGDDGKFSEVLTTKCVQAIFYCDDLRSLQVGLNNWVEQHLNSAKDAVRRQREEERRMTGGPAPNLPRYY